MSNLFHRADIGQTKRQKGIAILYLQVQSHQLVYIGADVFAQFDIIKYSFHANMRQLIAITISMNEYVPPIQPEQTYSQGFWHAIIAAVLYFLSSMILMLNMLGYFLGHYPQHFELSDEQRNLILQTMMFFIWLAAGAAVFARVEGWSFADSVGITSRPLLTLAKSFSYISVM